LFGNGHWLFQLFFDFKTSGFFLPIMSSSCPNPFLLRISIDRFILMNSLYILISISVAIEAARRGFFFTNERNSDTPWHCASPFLEDKREVDHLSATPRFDHLLLLFTGVSNAYDPVDEIGELPVYLDGMDWWKVQLYSRHHSVGDTPLLSNDILPVNYRIELSVDVRDHAGAPVSQVDIYPTEAISQRE
ncbi:hypothetical protein PFISCL1PPCAC_21173, partial [Pristionchus fissidentatus]